jgi:hypothetical protein
MAGASIAGVGPVDPFGTNQVGTQPDEQSSSLADQL